MKTRSPILRSALAGLLVAAMAAPAAAMPTAVPEAPAAPSDVIRVQDRGGLQNPGYHGHWQGHVYGGYGIYGGGGTGHEMVPDARGPVPPYWGGYQGYRYARPGYRYHDGWWFPPAAFALGAFITGAINQSARSSASLHVEWCYDNYRSYRAWDNTFQPNRGPRKQCNSPYR